jgi:hypothetical protein
MLDAQEDKRYAVLLGVVNVVYHLSFTHSFFLSLCGQE